MRVFLSALALWCSLSVMGQHTIKEQIHLIQQKHNVHFVYDAKMNLDAESRLSSLDAPLRIVLEKLFSGSGIGFRIRGHNIILKAEKQSPARYTVSGRVTDQNGEPVINASVYDITSGLGTLSNEKGLYVVHLTPGRHQLRVSYVGTKEKTETVELSHDRVVNFVLNNETLLSEVVVYADRNISMQATQTGRRTLTRDDIDTEFSLLSSPDLIKTLQHTSGVNSGVELASGLYVHGGGADENLYLLDGSPLYQTNHSLGLFSAFNSDIIKNVDFYKSGFPARYSGKVSSVTDVRTLDGNMHKVQGTYSVGTLDGRIQVEGPLWKEHTSFNIALRRSWVDLLLKPTLALIDAQSDDEKLNLGYAFHDFNAKITHRLSGNGSLWMSLYSGYDKNSIDNECLSGYYHFDTRNTICWGNRNVALGGDFVFSPTFNASVSLTGSYSHSRHDSEEDDTQHRGNIVHRTSLDLRRNSTRMADISGKADFSWSPSPVHRIRFGGSFTHHIFRPQTVQQSFYFGDPSEKVDTTEVNASCNVSSDEITIYAEDEMALFRKVSANIGCSFTHTMVSGKTYRLLDPRLALRYKASESLSFKTSYTHMSQSVHKIASTFLELPTDFWVPTTADIHPTLSNQFVAGAYLLPCRGMALSIEGFYKTTAHILQYRNWMGLQPSAALWDKVVTCGDGCSYGMEVDGTLHTSQLSATASYTLSWSKHRFPELHQGWFADQFDNRHKIDFGARWRVNGKVSLSASWTFHSGNRVTLPVAEVNLPRTSVDLGKEEMGYLYTEPNNFCLPAYHRLDVGADFRSTTKRGNERIWNVCIYNVYSHLNTMYVDVSKSDDGRFRAKCKGFIPLVPSVSYTLKF